jgi:hypothetical protein
VDNYRQGDVPLIPYYGALGGFERVEPQGGKLVLALGQATGHHHRIENCGFSNEPMADAARLFRDPLTGAHVIDVTAAGGVNLLHEEHDPIPLEPGRYIQLVQVEDDGEMISQVVD